MSYKARRRPTWKKKTDSWKLDLIDENTGEYMETIRVRNGRRKILMLSKKHGWEYVEKMLRDELIRIANTYEYKI
jgi:hypothetical protein